MGDYIVMSLVKGDETLGFRSDYAAAVERAIALSQSEHTAYGVYWQDDDGNWKLSGTAYEGVFTPKPDEEGL
jgi:hypothetical protein